MTIRRTKVKTLASSILQLFDELGTCQRKFLEHIFELWLCMRGRYNFAHLARYSDHSEKYLREHFAENFDWLKFNAELAERFLSTDRIIAIDPTFISKSGKHTAGVGKFWSGCAQKVQPGMEFTGIAAVDLPNNAALHLLAVQTAERDEQETLLEYYASLISLNRSGLRKLSKYVVGDAFFSRKPFIDSVLNDGFECVSRLRKDQHLRYLYVAPPGKKGVGRPKKFDGKVDPCNLREDVFKCASTSEDGKTKVFSAVVNVKALQRTCRVVIVQKLDDQGRVRNYKMYVSTDLELSAAKILQMYRARFQQEFLFRDAKQELGLDQAQGYSYEKNDFHINCALTVGSLCKAAHHLEPYAGQSEKPPFSIADIKTEYFNENQALRIIEGCGIDANQPLISKLLAEVRNWGKRRA